MSRSFTLFMLIGLVSGLIVGLTCNLTVHDPKALKSLAEYLGIVTDMFLRLIKMIIGPLVLSTLVEGLARMGSGLSVGRVGLKTLCWFFCASVAALLIGTGMVSLVHPGSTLHLKAAIDETARANDLQTSLSLRGSLTHLFPTSISDALARNDILQIVVFSTVAGTAIGALGEKAAGLLGLVEQLSRVMLKMTSYVMRLAPIAVFAAVAASVTAQGVKVLSAYAALIGGLYLAAALFCTFLLLAASVVLQGRIGGLLVAIREPALIAFSTASPEAAYPRLLEELEAFGVSKRVAGFVLPLGYSDNLDGSMIYCTFATLFVAQSFRVHMSLADILMMMAVFIVTSRGLAGVPRAALVVVAANWPTFHLPETAGLDANSLGIKPLSRRG